MRVLTAHSEDRGYVESVAAKVMSAYDGKGIEWKHPVDDPELWKLNSGQRAGVVGMELNGRRCCVKLFYDGRIQARLRNLLGFSKAKRAYESALKLKAKDVGCPEMMGWVQVKPSGPCIVVSELCDYAFRTDRYIAEHGISAELVIAFAAFVRTMHEKGIAHVDFSLRNTMVTVRKDKPRYQFLLLDFEDARFYPALSRSQRLDNLHHLLERVFKTVPVEWQLLFLRRYLREESIREWVADLSEMIRRNPSKYTTQL